MQRTADLLLRMQELKDSITVLKDVEKVETALANLVAAIDYFEWVNRLTIDPQRVEAEFDRYDEESDDMTTQRQDPMI